MVMRKSLLATVVVSGFIYGSFAYADSHTVAVGYAQSKVQNFKDIRGVNLHYRYEWDSPVSIIGSFTYMKGDKNGNYKSEDSIEKGSLDVKYYSLVAGPAYRINDYVSVYGLLGFAHSTLDVSVSKSIKINRRITSITGKADSKSTNFVYGAGVEVNPIQNISLYAGYEGASAKHYDKNFGINGFNIGVGYRF
ncbi:Ail/Lom family outer membrane beta-barrel protein [Xenorhabdus hominickii]|uniref:Virulence membrane protein PagC n=1 Tax=Xenorhabdus hominickii TaxID=351679 RepID=A0A2G0QDY5_XENHO|nr:Ail/Lom family outer membrane beta-barrel protein [Xenorhabdus hominickii]AOM41451.1 virulence protein [Xenorhabdus hominickii]PHM57379.1 virulence membrane protein PagC [Xenorhabdus hominickii]